MAVLPLLFALIGLVLYTVLGGADFGAGLWQLLAGRGPAADRIREHAHQANAPVWEANHVWLIFVVTVLWTAYPTVIGSVSATLSVPLGLAALGIVLRGLTYAMQTAIGRPVPLVENAFALACLVSPFMLGAVIGALASGRVPVGTSGGDLVGSWVNPTSVLAGGLAVLTSAFLGAVYLAADARRLRAAELERAFRLRALISGALCGAVAIGGLVVVDHDAHRIFLGLVTGWGVVAVVVSGAAGVVSLALVARRSFGVARLAAATAVAALVAGWAVAQRPFLLPGLTLRMAAADTRTLVCLVVATVAGALIVLPALGYLFRLSLSGRFDPGRAPGAAVAPAPVSRSRRLPAAPVAAACLVAGFVLLTIADAPAAHAAGVLLLSGAAIAGFTAVDPAGLAGRGDAVNESDD
ncbi:MULTISPECIES: cytochrome d ubiquinol oxidase subunit II [Amycolatopsis]|uniref:Cytochrome d ubiquinol oxidase subunit II n=2 Tax=Amycolatopsis TaxID=1813 RepID=A0A1I3WRU0_9PSEU|nr:cytochrome d ubiquinol oxidase subunit II [Amycolatopsis sacchari]SFK09161.1 cytochrome d ubiquinol oxidase subunit II [Amycolatopsis sacchari]